MKSSVVIKRSVVVDGHKTSVSLEDPFWAGLKQIAYAQQMTLSDLVGKIDGAREQSNLSSALRLFVLQHFRNLFVLHHVGDEEVRTDVAKARLSTVGGSSSSAT